MHTLHINQILRHIVTQNYGKNNITNECLQSVTQTNARTAYSTHRNTSHAGSDGLRLERQALDVRGHIITKVCNMYMSTISIYIEYTIVTSRYGNLLLHVYTIASGNCRLPRGTENSAMAICLPYKLHLIS